MKNYREIHDWITGNITAGTLSYSDMILSVLTSVSLSGVEFTTQAQDVEYLQAEATFRYDRFALL